MLIGSADRSTSANLLPTRKRIISKQAAPFPLPFSSPFHAFNHNHLWLLLSRVKSLSAHHIRTLESSKSIHTEGECGIRASSLARKGFGRFLQAIWAFLAALHYTTLRSLPLLTKQLRLRDSINMSSPYEYPSGNPGGFKTPLKPASQKGVQKVRNSLSSVFIPQTAVVCQRETPNYSKCITFEHSDTHLDEVDSRERPQTPHIHLV